MPRPPLALPGPQAPFTWTPEAARGTSEALRPSLGLFKMRGTKQRRTTGPWISHPCHKTMWLCSWVVWTLLCNQEQSSCGKHGCHLTSRFPMGAFCTLHFMNLTAVGVRREGARGSQAILRPGRWRDPTSGSWSLCRRQQAEAQVGRTRCGAAQH